jgi:hypothetical protein
LRLNALAKDMVMDRTSGIACAKEFHVTKTGEKRLQATINVRRQRVN